MRAAVVRTFDSVPRYEEFAGPVPANDHEEVVEVLAAGLHPRVRSQADGSHYTSTEELPLIPGIDGVGRRADGSLVYFILPDTVYGSMAERTVIDVRRSVPLPADADAVLLAAAMNPAMSSWVALRKRIAFEPGRSVLILGATGSAGQLAIQVAKRLGASRVVAAGRDADRLAALGALGADATIDLAAAPERVAAQLAAEAADVDVVLDYLWGAPAESAIMPLLTARADRGKLLSWIEIGSVAGPDITLPSAALRQANVQFLGSGQGSVTAAGILEVLPSLVEEIDAGTFSIDVVTRPLAEVERIWTESPDRSTERIVFVPAS
ncbi:MAG TPA: zinc-binding alcohol dehydrogenase family protein [Lacisediminihabitans sp.]|uniref:zinc-binding alcohol dehydrogenase family protein n=1 Tax=Lacisediminihabitans sp. TaxID=2787631 RepID=UPI002ED9C47F